MHNDFVNKPGIISNFKTRGLNAFTTLNFRQFNTVGADATDFCSRDKKKNKRWPTRFDTNKIYKRTRRLSLHATQTTHSYVAFFNFFVFCFHHTNDTISKKSIKSNQMHKIEMIKITRDIDEALTWWKIVKIFNDCRCNLLCFYYYGGWRVENFGRWPCRALCVVRQMKCNGCTRYVRLVWHEHRNCRTLHERWRHWATRTRNGCTKWKYLHVCVCCMLRACAFLTYCVAMVNVCGVCIVQLPVCTWCIGMQLLLEGMRKRERESVGIGTSIIRMKCQTIRDQTFAQLFKNEKGIFAHFFPFSIFVFIFSFISHQIRWIRLRFFEYKCHLLPCSNLYWVREEVLSVIFGQNRSTPTIICFDPCTTHSMQ